MDQDSFAISLRDDGYAETVVRVHPAGHATERHIHDYDVRALVLAGEITLTSDGVGTRYGTGEIFTMAHGREHTETVGSTGVTFLAGRRNPG